jgi:hypothetical protein
LNDAIYKFCRRLPILIFLVLAIPDAAAGGVKQEKMSASIDWATYQRRIERVRQTPGLAAFWDFVQREDGPAGSGRFVAYTATDGSGYPLEPHNVSRDFWHDGAEATLADFPLLGRGPFGQAVQFRAPKVQNDLPVLLVPRAKLHDTPLDVKGPGKSVSMVVWLIYQEGAHAIAGIWHEGTVSPPKDIPAVVKVRGQRQYGMFAGLGANPGGVGAHVSENGLASFGDRYARHMAVTPEKMERIKSDATPEQLDTGWSVVGFVCDNEKKTVTAYLDGVATEYWVDAPANSRFYQSAARAWSQARMARLPGLQSGEDPGFPRDQFYEPPENVPLSESVLSESGDHRVVLRIYEFTKVRVTLRKDAKGQFSEVAAAELAALKTNPYWFGHDIYTPANAEEGGPFTIGRVIHSNRHETLSGYFGGVAVFAQALTPGEMAELSQIGRRPLPGDGGKPLSLSEILQARAKK